jgi:hypothetical protein
MSDSRTIDDSLNESEGLLNNLDFKKNQNENYWNENETFATSEATTRVSNEDLLKENFDK